MTGSTEIGYCLDSKPTAGDGSAAGVSMDSTRIDEPMKWSGISDGYEEGSSETRSNMVRCSPVNETHSSSPSADKGTAGSLMLESPDSEIVANQNLCDEDASAVLNSSGSCNFQRLCKRKQDDCTDSSHSRDPCNDKRQSKDNSLADNIPGADNQAAKHLPSTVDIHDEGNAMHEGRQQKYKKEATGVGKLGILVHESFQTANLDAIEIA
nr:unnamed protein product [Digitaria exilis]